jgi:hypothetical protein
MKAGVLWIVIAIGLGMLSAQDPAKRVPMTFELACAGGIVRC